ncbi:MAG: hypothetical protein AAGD11_00140 [Planctomycetota bacterium]
MAKLDFDLPVPQLGKVSIPGGYLVPAIGLGVFAHSIRLHDRISDVLRIRHTFDTRVILRRFAEELEIGDVDAVFSNRSRAMRIAFYSYASSTDPKIDKHSILEALDNWAWFWSLVESWFVVTTTGVVLTVFGSEKIGIATVGVATAGLLLLSPIYLSQCKRYANIQIDAILELENSKSVIAEKLNALSN